MTQAATKQIALGLPEAPVIAPGARKTYQVDPDANMAVVDNLTYLHDLVDGSMKLIVTSPPYNIGKAYERRTSLERYLKNQRGQAQFSSG